MKSYYWLILLMLLSFCSVFDGSDSSKIELDHSWELVEFVERNGEEVQLIDYETHILRFANDMELGGEAACNQYGGEYRAEKSGNLTIKNLFVTEIACQQPSLEEEFLDVLAKVSDYRKEEGVLVLSFGKKGRLVFQERLE